MHAQIFLIHAKMYVHSHAFFVDYNNLLPHALHACAVGYLW